MKMKNKIIILLAVFAALIVILPAQVSAAPIRDDLDFINEDVTEELWDGTSDGDSDTGEDGTSGQNTGAATDETATASSNEHINSMMEKIRGWYILGRNIAVPLAILSFASCGFKVLFNVLSTKGEYRFDAIMRQFLYTGMAIALILLLPVIVQMVIDIVKRVAWKPPK